MRAKIWIFFLLWSLLITSCSGGTEETSRTTSAATKPAVTQTSETETTAMEEIVLTIDDVQVPVIWEDNKTAAALKELCRKSPLKIDMSMYGGFEQVGPVGQSLPNNDTQMTTRCGDIVLYSADRIVLFYGSNSWSYTKLGQMDLQDKEIREMLSKGDVTVKLYCK